MRHVLSILLFLFLPVAVLSAFGTMEISSAPGTVQREYGFSSEVVESVEVTLTSSESFAGSEYYLGISAGQSGDPENRLLSDGAGRTVPYRITSVGGSYDLKDLNDSPGENEILAGSAGSGRSVTESFEVRFPAGLTPPAATYTDTVTLMAWSRNLSGEYSITDQRTVEIVLIVPERVDVALVPRGGAFDPGGDSYTVDFGFFSPGEIGLVDLMVRGNTAYSVSMESANGGVMSHLDPADSSTVPYVFRIDGTPRSLAGGPQTVHTAPGVPDAAGDRYNLEFEVQEFGNATSGDYQDILQIVVTAQ